MFFKGTGEEEISFVWRGTREGGARAQNKVQHKRKKEEVVETEEGGGGGGWREV